jgi:hypothetical protein
MTVASTLAVVAVTVTVMPLQATAQRLDERLRSFEPEVRLRIRTVNQGIHIGRLARVEGDTLYLTPERGSATVGIDAIDRLWVRGTASKKGATIGGVTGAVLGAVSFALLSYGICDAAECSVDGRVAVVGGVVIGAAGAVTGAVLGAMFGQWHLKFP